MYEQQFGLKKRPFRARATGSEVFVGPQSVATMAGLKNGLGVQDAVVCVAGPVGSGKTTLVERSLTSFGERSIIIYIARMHLNCSDVLNLLVDQIGVDDMTSGPIQRFAAFRSKLEELENGGARVFVVVEDCQRLGEDALAELEALTAADSGPSEGAAIILMSDERLPEFLNNPLLTRLQQRTRQRHEVGPLCAAELRGYLRHCFRLAGGEFEHVFADGAGELLYQLSAGIPRMANNIVDASMRAAADAAMATVSLDLIREMASQEFGLETPPPAELAAEPAAAIVAEAVEAPVAESKPAAKIVAEPNDDPIAIADPELEPVAELLPELAEDPIAASEAFTEIEDQGIDLAAMPADPVIVFTDEPAIEPIAEPAPVMQAEAPTPVAAVSIADELAALEPEIPELIQDTLPDLEILAPQLALRETEVNAQSETELPDQDITDTETIVEPEAVAELPEIESSADDVPAWDRDPTLAELRPDFDALNEALAFTADETDLDQSAAEEDIPVLAPSSEPEAEIIPEITLDHAISQRIDSNLIDEPGEVSAPKPADDALVASTEIKLPARNSRKADAEIDKIAAELSRAKSLEDVDDRMAETLFGEEISFVAAQVLANPATSDPEPANDALNAMQATGEEPGAELQIEAGREPDRHEQDGVEVTLEAHDGGMDLSASQRLKTVRALNADLHPSLREPKTTAATSTPAEPLPAPAPIEDQINISMTQTLKALKIRPSVADDDDEDEEKRGFFSRFKR